ncbi:hypothetical protein MTR67_043242 [Solanum verrucosum]|uniref:Uncharacterized protein n=1 Tax=Solanum verrucosum TaxID=315347 RepID=A0AAF0UPA7_SOLVR|nr:hypothetical protein MTR67_043242 [Solanum verrucosum]
MTVQAKKKANVPMNSNVGTMGVTMIEKVELATYQLKGVAEVWIEQWNEERVVDASPLDWEKFKVPFIDRYYPTIVANSSAILSRFVLGFSKIVVKECSYLIPPYRMAPTELKELKQQLKDLLDKVFIIPSICSDPKN